MCLKVLKVALLLQCVVDANFQMGVSLPGFQCFLTKQSKEIFVDDSSLSRLFVAA